MTPSIREIITCMGGFLHYALRDSEPFEDSEHESLLLAGFNANDIECPSKHQIFREVKAFLMANWHAVKDSKLELSRIGELFWLARNRSGYRFEDEFNFRDEAACLVARNLDAGAQKFPEAHLLLTDNQKIQYFSG